MGPMGRMMPLDVHAYSLHPEAVRMARVMAERWGWSDGDWRAFTNYLASQEPADQLAGVTAVYSLDTEQRAWVGL